MESHPEIGGTVWNWGRMGHTATEEKMPYFLSVKLEEKHGQRCQSFRGWDSRVCGQVQLSCPLFYWEVINVLGSKNYRLLLGSGGLPRGT